MTTQELLRKHYLNISACIFDIMNAASKSDDNQYMSDGEALDMALRVMRSFRDDVEQLTN